MGKAFEKQTKIIEDQEERPIKKNIYDVKDSLLILKQREIFNKLVDKRFKWITELKNKVNPDDLIYR